LTVVISAFRIAKTTAITRRAKRGLVGREDEEIMTRLARYYRLHCICPALTDIDFRDKCHLVADPEVDSVIRGSVSDEGRSEVRAGLAFAGSERVSIERSDQSEFASAADLGSSVTKVTLLRRLKMREVLGSLTA
jgi:hypothetical protein